MAFLYAGLGISMFTGIFAMFQMSNALLQQQILSKPPDNNYSQTIYQTNDKKFLKVLENANSEWGAGDMLCQSIKDEIANMAGDIMPLKEYINADSNNSDSIRFLGTCFLAKGKHRILITPNYSEDRINLFSCLLDEKDFCDFEENSI